MVWFEVKGVFFIYLGKAFSHNTPRPLQFIGVFRITALPKRTVRLLKIQLANNEATCISPIKSIFTCAASRRKSTKRTLRTGIKMRVKLLNTLKNASTADSCSHIRPSLAENLGSKKSSLTMGHELTETYFHACLVPRGSKFALQFHRPNLMCARLSQLSIPFSQGSEYRVTNHFRPLI